MRRAASLSPLLALALVLSCDEQTPSPARDAKTDGGAEGGGALSDAGPGPSTAKEAGIVPTGPDCTGMTFCEPFDDALASIKARWSTGEETGGVLEQIPDGHTGGALRTKLLGVDSAPSSARLLKDMGAIVPATEVTVRFCVRLQPESIVLQDLLSIDVFSSKTGDIADFDALYIGLGGILMYRQNRSVEATNVKVADGEWHQIELRFNPITDILRVDDHEPIALLGTVWPTGTATFKVGAATKDQVTPATTDFDNVGITFR